MQIADLDHESVEPTYRRFVKILIPILSLVRRKDWRNQEKIPASGGVIFAVNHISNFDAIAVGEYLINSGRWPRFLAKKEIFRTPLLGWLARACGQIPVYRESQRAKEALIHAEHALAKGKAVLIYPEGTITADPDWWPMTGRRGVAKLALQKGYPIVPIGQYGAQYVLGGKRLEWWRLFTGRKTMSVMAGDPVDLSDFAGLELTDQVLDAAVVQIMDAITALVEEIRGEPAPALRYDPRKGYRITQSKVIPPK